MIAGTKEIQGFRVAPGSNVDLSAWSTDWQGTPEMQKLKPSELADQAKEHVAERVDELSECQELLWADNRFALLVVFQGMDAAGKDSTIKHVTSGVNPAGIRVVSFKEPSHEDLDHDYLWRHVRMLPEHGQIGIFNRSYYEDVIVVRVHPELLKARSFHQREPDDRFWSDRFREINDFERYLVNNGTVVVKFFLHVSREEQRKRLLARTEDPEKHWKFSFRDLETREHWDEYQRVFNDMLSNTSTEWAPWWVIPGDHKWVMRAVVSQVLVDTVKGLGLRYPALDDEKREQMRIARELLAQK